MSASSPNTAVATQPFATEEPVLDALHRACEKIPPAWPLENFVTVNPYLGLKDHSFEEAADRLAKTAGARTTLPVSYYLEAIEEGRITEADLATALKDREDAPAANVGELLLQLRTESNEDAFAAEVPTVADVAHAETGADWNRLATDQVSDWAGAYFDRGQALWRSTEAAQPLFTAWKEEACVDRTPEVMGLTGFRDVIDALPDDPRDAAQEALARLDVPRDGLDPYLHRVLMRVGGWSSFAARIVWNRKRYADQEDDTLLQFLAVLLCWEAALLDTVPDSNLDAAWDDAKDTLLALGHASERSDALERHLLLQDAFDRAAQRRLVERVNNHSPSAPNDQRPDAQAVFCIDVRSEVLRRHLETVAPAVDTLGFAGFFGIPIEYVPIGHEEGEAQCPPLLTPEHTVLEKMPDDEAHNDAVSGRRLKHHVKRAWNAFKMGAISCFSFVGPVGLAYLPKMITDTLGWTRPVPAPDKKGLDEKAVAEKAPSLEPAKHDHQSVGMPLEDRVDTAEDMLRAMSLTEDFAHLVMITGHEATTANNPYDSGLDCGACSGHSGEPNARVAATILNDADVREKLDERGISIPHDTVFLAAKHNTTTDEVTILNEDVVPASHRERLKNLKEWLDEASHRTRQERADRFHLPDDASTDEAVIERSTDWSQVRPEWGLAGCKSFIVAPRQRTEKLDLEGRAFLHNYDWRQDEDFSILELIMTAPVVVTSWISLQYYASTVDNQVFGAGNKTLHNVVGKLGVLEGNAGDLRVGLPWQSVHDGDTYQHEPLRLNVVIEAPREAMSNILARNDDVRALFDNGWLHLLAMEEGTITHRYTGDLTWTPIET